MFNGFVLLYIEHRLDKVLNSFLHLHLIHLHFSIRTILKRSEVTLTTERVSIRIKTEKDQFAESEVFVQLYLPLLLAGIACVSEFVNLKDETMASKINQDIGTITGTTAINTTVMGYGEGISEIRTEGVHDVVFFEAITACAGFIGMKHTVASEAIGITTRTLGDICVLTVRTSVFWRTEITFVFLPTVFAYVGGICTFGAHVFSSLMDTYLRPSAFHALTTYFLMVADVWARTGDAPVLIPSVGTDVRTATGHTTRTTFTVFAGLFPLAFNAYLSSAVMLTHFLAPTIQTTAT